MSEAHTSVSALVEQPSANGDVVVSVVIPALNEAEAIEACVRKSLETMQAHGLNGEVVVADNGSDDGTRSSPRGRRARDP